MPWHTRWRNVFRSEQLNRELDDELAHHLAETADRFESEGLSPEEAIRRARLLLGNYSIQKENTREMNIAAWLDQTRADILYGLRQLRLSPAFSAVAILSLALGIGANTAIFQLINAIRLKTLPVKDPQQLVALKFAEGSRRSGWSSSRSAEFTYAQWQQLEKQDEPFSGLLAFSAARFNLTTGGEPRFAEGMYVSGDFFRVLGVPALLGRTFTTQDDALSCTAAAVISHAFWQREFGGDPQIIGRKMTLDGYPVPIIGVTPPSFYGVEVGYRYDVAVPLCADTLISGAESGRLSNRIAWWLSIIDRLKPGWTEQRASAYLRAISPAVMRASLPPEYQPEFAKRFLANKLTAEQGANGLSDLRFEYARPLYLLLSITALVLLIACANLANLLLARATVRETEVALRLALGASRARVVCQLLGESLLLALFGALLGALLAFALSRSLILLITSSENPLFLDASIDWRVLGFTGALAVLTCLLFGLLPALRATHLSPASAMQAGGRSLTADRERLSLRRALVAVQMALSVVLLFGALLFVRSFRNLLDTNPGFQAEGLLSVRIEFGKAGIPKTQRLNTYREFLEKFSSIPGVVSAAQVALIPLGGFRWNQSIGVDGAPAATTSKFSFMNRVSPGYFQTMQTRLIAGRSFNDYDTVGALKVAIVNEEFARQFFPHANPIGHTFRIDAEAGKPEPLFQIVGLVENTKYYQLSEDAVPIAYLPIAQDEEPSSDASYVLRVGGSPSSVIRQTIAITASVNPLIGIECKPLSRGPIMETKHQSRLHPIAMNHVDLVPLGNHLSGFVLEHHKAMHGALHVFNRNRLGEQAGARGNGNRRRENAALRGNESPGLCYGWRAIHTA